MALITCTSNPPIFKSIEKIIIDIKKANTIIVFMNTLRNLFKIILLLSIIDKEIKN